jgi:arsenate reductase
MQEIGIDMGFATTASLSDALAEESPEAIVTMGCGEQCPVVPGVQRLDWDVPDPAGEEIDGMRRIRDQIEAKVNDYIRTCS